MKDLDSMKDPKKVTELLRKTLQDADGYFAVARKLIVAGKLFARDTDILNHKIAMLAFHEYEKVGREKAEEHTTKYIETILSLNEEFRGATLAYLDLMLPSAAGKPKPNAPGVREEYQEGLNDIPENMAEAITKALLMDKFTK